MRGTKFCKAFIAINWIIAATLVACGGGGSGSNKAPPIEPVIATPVAHIYIDASGILAPVAVSLKVGAYTETINITEDGRFNSSRTWPVGSHFAASFNTSSGTCDIDQPRGQITEQTVASIHLRCKAPPPLASISGSIQLNEGFVQDNTLNDVSADFLDNTRAEVAQALASETRVIGFVSASIETKNSADWRTSPRANPQDFYRARLNGGQIVELHQYHSESTDIGENSDVDIFLLDAESQALIAYDTSHDSSVRLSVPADGDYLIQIHAARGSATYQLLLTRPSASVQVVNAATNSQVNNPIDFIAGEAVVEWATPDVNSLSIQAMSQSYDLNAARTPSPRLIKLAAHLPVFGTAQSFGTQQSVGVQQGVVAQQGVGAQTAPALSAVQTLMAIKALAQSPDVRFAEPNYRRDTLSVGTAPDPNRALQWSLDAIGIDPAWQLVREYPAREVIVAVLDTGIMKHHPDLRGNLIDGFDFVSDAHNAGDGDGLDPDPETVHRDEISSNPWHASHVAGIIAAQSNNGEGIAGLGMHTRIMPLRVIGLNGGTSYDLAQAIRYAAGLPNDSGRLPQQRADIINLSVGGYGASQYEQDTLNAVAAAGVIIVASAGNRGTEEVNYPAGYRQVLSVSALNHLGARADYANFGATVDLAAPGGSPAKGILSCYASRVDANHPFVGSYAHMYGTSMAAPHMAGVLALMKAVRPTLTLSDVEQLLAEGLLTDDAGEPGWDAFYGWGKLNAHKAVLAARDFDNRTSSPTPVLTASPTRLDTRVSGTQTLQISQTGGAPVRLKEMATTADWVQISLTKQGSQNGDWVFEYLVTVQLKTLPEGKSEAQIRFDFYDQPTVVVPVQVHKMTPSRAASNAPLYVNLMGANATYQVRATPDKTTMGVWHYRFDAVEAGAYQLQASTDLDGDERFCHEGEVCGRYHSSTQDPWLKVDGAAHNGVDIILQLPSVEARGP